MNKMPDNASFPVPSGPHAGWTDQDWYNYWKSTGGRIDNSPPYVNPNPMPPKSQKDWGYFIKDMEESFKKGLDN